MIQVPGQEKIKAPVEFCRKVLVADIEEGVVTYYDAYEGNPMMIHYLLVL